MTKVYSIPEQIERELNLLIIHNTRGRVIPDAIFLRSDLWDIMYKHWWPNVICRVNTSWHHMLYMNLMIIPDDCKERMRVCMELSEK